MPAKHLYDYCGSLFKLRGRTRGQAVTPIWLILKMTFRPVWVSACHSNGLTPCARGARGAALA